MNIKVKFVIFLSLFFLVGCVATKYTKQDGNLVFEDQKVQFADLAPNWKERDSTKFNIHAFQNTEHRARIWIKAGKFTKDLSAKETADSWIGVMADKYSWENFDYVSEGSKMIDGQEAYTAVYKYRMRGRDFKDKIYRLIQNNMLYQFRLSAKADSYDNVITDFDRWTNTIRFL